MIRRNGVDWLVISAQGAPWGATINTQHITNVRVQPQMKMEGDGKGNEGLVPTGFIEVAVCCIDGQQSLTFKDQDDAMTEYFRISNELRGSVIDETKTGGDR